MAEELNCVKPLVDTEPVRIAQSALPYDYSDNKAKYLGLRCCGFTVRETLSELGLAKSTLSLWREDYKFAQLEKKLPELRKTLGIEYVTLEYLRNYRKFLKKDHEVISAALEKDEEGKPVELSKVDADYLLKARAHYTPQQLQALEALLNHGSAAEENFTEIVLQMRRTQQDTLTLTRGNPVNRGQVIIDGNIETGDS
jgi:hypothetical protein